MEDIRKMKFNQKPADFSWEDLGNLTVGRSILGEDMPVIVYRLFQYALKNILAREYDEQTASNLFRAAGHLAGIHFAENVLDLSGDFDFFITNLQRTLQEMKIGILRVEQANLTDMKFTLTVSEDLDCSGLPITDESVCDYDEGFISGILEKYSGLEFNVSEIDCWASGDRTCRFSVEPSENK